MSENALNHMIKKMGYQGKMVGHGFRSLFSTVTNEQGFNPDAIERQLAHLEGNTVRAAYNRADYLSERREIMQWWADWLDGQNHVIREKHTRRKKDARFLLRQIDGNSATQLAHKMDQPHFRSLTI